MSVKPEEIERFDDKTVFTSNNPNSNNGYMLHAEVSNSQDIAEQNELLRQQNEFLKIGR